MWTIKTLGLALEGRGQFTQALAPPDAAAAAAFVTSREENDASAAALAAASAAAATSCAAVPARPSAAAFAAAFAAAAARSASDKAKREAAAAFKRCSSAVRRLCMSIDEWLTQSIQGAHLPEHVAATQRNATPGRAQGNPTFRPNPKRGQPSLASADD